MSSKTDVISPEKTRQIEAMLTEIEQKHNVFVIHAVESGSRAWGFPSSDSDYDVRFIYHHEPQWYITAFDKKDHIDLAFFDDLDASGWDIGKSLRLLYRGNASFHEWLNSPVVYRSDYEKCLSLHQLANDVFNPAAAFYHYVSLAKKKLRDPASQKNAKAFLYGLRALLCATWIRDIDNAPPVLFGELVAKYFSDEQSKLLQDVLSAKQCGGEQDLMMMPDSVWHWSQNTLSVLEQTQVNAKRDGDSGTYDRVLHKILGL